MQLTGKLDSPYLRRGAFSLQQLLELRFGHRSVSSPTSETIDPAGLTSAALRHVIPQATPGAAPASAHPRQQACSQAAVQRPAFIAALHGDRVCRA